MNSKNSKAHTGRDCLSSLHSLPYVSRTKSLTYAKGSLIRPSLAAGTHPVPRFASTPRSSSDNSTVRRWHGVHRSMMRLQAFPPRFSQPSCALPTSERTMRRSSSRTVCINGIRSITSRQRCCSVSRTSSSLPGSKCG